MILECSELIILARRVGVSVCCEDSLRVGRCGNLRRHGADSPLAVKDIGVYWLVFDDMEELSKMPIRLVEGHELRTSHLLAGLVERRKFNLIRGQALVGERCTRRNVSRQLAGPTGTIATFPTGGELSSTHVLGSYRGRGCQF